MRTPGFVRWLRPRAAAAAASLFLSGAMACTSTAPAPPAPPDPDEEIVASLTKTLTLDTVQQKRTREVLKEMSDRDEAIRAGWSKGQRVEPTALQNSHGQFDRDFQAILSVEQRRTFIENRSRLLMRTRAPAS